jgi:hypothetical protein
LQPILTEIGVFFGNKKYYTMILYNQKQCTSPVVSTLTGAVKD